MPLKAEQKSGKSIKKLRTLRGAKVACRNAGKEE